jgi:hypothetical protein
MDRENTLAMIGILQTIPTTPLIERLCQEGRLVEDEPNCHLIARQIARTRQSRAIGTYF